jgi:hypothetical protein
MAPAGRAGKHKNWTCGALHRSLASGQDEGVRLVLTDFPAAPRVSARNVAAALALLAGSGLIACSSPARIAAAAGRGRDERLDHLLPGARDDDGGDLRGHRRERPRRDERPARGGRDVRGMEADLGRRGRPRRALRLSIADGHAAATRDAGRPAGRPPGPLGALGRPSRRPRAASCRHLPGGREGHEGAPGGDATAWNSACARSMSACWARHSASIAFSRSEIADLRRQVDAGRGDLVAQHNALAGRRGALAEEYNRLVADANGLIDALNWARW